MKRATAIRNLSMHWLRAYPTTVWEKGTVPFFSQGTEKSGQSPTVFGYALGDAAVFCALVASAVAVRLISETPNFGAVAAAALFAGFYFRQTVWAVAVPLSILTISDQFLGGYARPVMLAVYGSLLVPIAWRAVLRRGLSFTRIGAGAVSSSVTFYLLTNLAVWYAWYPHTWADLMHCYAIALPFFANTVASDLVFAGAFFGLYALAVAFRPAPVALAEGA